MVSNETIKLRIQLSFDSNYILIINIHRVKMYYSLTQRIMQFKYTPITISVLFNNLLN